MKLKVKDLVNLFEGVNEFRTSVDIREVKDNTYTIKGKRIILKTDDYYGWFDEDDNEYNIGKEFVNTKDICTFIEDGRIITQFSLI